MYILAFETSCDDTSVALFSDNVLLAISTHTQGEHDSTGGVVPEVAARSHAHAIFPCIDNVLSQSSISLDQINLIACTKEPGLMPSLLIGMIVAETLSLSLKVPLIWVNHIEAHMFANLIERSIEDVIFPSVVLTVSGGHTEIYRWQSLFDFELLGQTHDDAAGECFDKVAKMLGLGFPGGKRIADLSNLYMQTTEYQDTIKLPPIFPIVLLGKESLDFSFSGLKSAIKRYIDDSLKSNGSLTEKDIMYIAYQTERTITEILCQKIYRAYEQTQAKMICLAGGVSANTVLRDKIANFTNTVGIPFLSPVKNIYSMDNAAMVGMYAYYEYNKNI